MSRPLRHCTQAVSACSGEYDRSFAGQPGVTPVSCCSQLRDFGRGAAGCVKAWSCVGCHRLRVCPCLVFGSKESTSGVGPGHELRLRLEGVAGSSDQRPWLLEAKGRRELDQNVGSHLRSGKSLRKAPC